MRSAWVEILLLIQVIAVPITFNLSHVTCRVSHVTYPWTYLAFFRICRATQRDEQINEFLYYKTIEVRAALQLSF